MIRRWTPLNSLLHFYFTLNTVYNVQTPRLIKIPLSHTWILQLVIREFHQDFSEIIDCQKKERKVWEQECKNEARLIRMVCNCGCGNILISIRFPLNVDFLLEYCALTFQLLHLSLMTHDSWLMTHGVMNWFNIQRKPISLYRLMEKYLLKRFNDWNLSFAHIRYFVIFQSSNRLIRTNILLPTPIQLWWNQFVISVPSFFLTVYEWINVCNKDQ